MFFVKASIFNQFRKMLNVFLQKDGIVKKLFVAFITKELGGFLLAPRTRIEDSFGLGSPSIA